MNHSAALYARVSSDQQKEKHTIASQIAALHEYAQAHGYTVPPEWVFQDEGYSGANLSRPGLEALRDLAAEGQITTVLVYSPDRLCRKYAYQVLLVEELSRCGVQLRFLKSPPGETPEDRLLEQVQGVISEYERAQIAERCRRGKRHRAKQGAVSVFSGAPYGYRYVRKSETSAAYYQVIESEAQVVGLIFQAYTEQGFSIAAIARLLNEQNIPTRTGRSRWQRCTVWGMLRNPAYCGIACYGKTELCPRQRITRRLRQRQGWSNRDSADRDRPRPQWIEVPVPALISEATFALAQEQMQKNKQYSPRHTLEPSLLQGMLVCQQCGYALYRVSSRCGQKKRVYYRCPSSDRARRPQGPSCITGSIRQDRLDSLVWSETIRLLDDPALLQAEMDRRQQIARQADPWRQREEQLRHEQSRLQTQRDRLTTAYQEELVTLEELRQRLPELRRQSQAMESELQSLEMAALDQTRYLQLAHNLSAFRATLRARAETLSLSERQQILRLIVKEVLVSRDTITLRHSIRLPSPEPGPDVSPPRSPSSDPSTQGPGRGYRLCMRRQVAALQIPCQACRTAINYGCVRCPEDRRHPR